MEKIKEKLLQASFLLTISVLKIRKTQTYLFSIVLSQITMLTKLREKNAAVWIMRFQGSKSAVSSYHSCFTFAFPLQTVIWRWTGKKVIVTINNTLLK